MERCWEELRRAGQQLAEDHGYLRVLSAVAIDFELPRSPEAEAVRVFLDGLRCNLEGKRLAVMPPPLPEAAQ